MNSYVLYHGANAEKMLFNVRNFGLTSDLEGKLYFSQNEWKNCLVHGADLATGESYVAKVKLTVPDGVRIDRTPRAGNPDALILITNPQRLIRCEFVELYVRSGTVGEFEIKNIQGPAMDAYLVGVLQK
jgi:hypothetical protein